MKQSSRPIVWLSAVLTLTAVVAAPLPSRAGGAPLGDSYTVTLSDYQSLLNDYDNAIGDGERVTPDAAARLQERFSIARTVVTLDGRKILVDNTREIRTLEHIAGTRHGAEADEDAQTRAASLDGLVNAEPGGVRVGDSAQIAQSVLRRAEFQYQDTKFAHPEVHMNWLERFFDSIGRGMQSMGNAIERWLKSLNFHPNVPNPKFGSMAALAGFVKFLFFSLLVIAAVVGLTILTLNWRRNGGTISFGKRKTETGLDLEPDERHDPLAAARRMAEQGDYRGAIRLAYIASLRRLAAAGLLVLEPNKTNWEYQRDLRGRSARHYANLLPATGIFDRVWYGRRVGTAQEFERVVAAHDALPDSPTSAQMDGGDAESGIATAAADRASEAAASTEEAR